MTTPTGLCGCGCGARTPIAQETRVRDGKVKGQPLRFIHGHNARGPRRGPVLRTKAEYAEVLAGIAEEFVGAVRDESPDEAAIVYRRAITLPTPSDVDGALAFAICLAAQVDVDAPRSRRLGWVEELDPSTRTELSVVRPLGAAS